MSQVIQRVSHFHMARHIIVHAATSLRDLTVLASPLLTIRGQITLQRVHLQASIRIEAFCLLQAG